MADRALLAELMKMIEASVAAGPVADGPDLKCKESEPPDLARYVRNDMSSSEQVEVERHALSCPACLQRIGVLFAGGTVSHDDEEALHARYFDRTIQLMDQLDAESQFLDPVMKVRYRTGAADVPERPPTRRKKRVGKKVDRD